MNSGNRHPSLVFRLATMAVLVVVIDLGATMHSHAADRCRNVTGSWNWFTGHRVVISPAGSVTSHKPGITHPATWKCLDPQSGQIQIRWTEAAGFLIDTLALSPDGSGLSGHNNFGAAVTGQRIGPPPRIAGEERAKVAKRRTRAAKPTARAPAQPRPAPTSRPSIERAKPVPPDIIQLKPVEGARP